MSQARKPDPETVTRIASEEAAVVGVNVDDVLAMRESRLVVLARRRAFTRILAETGCSNSGLATVWGCDRQIPGRYARGPVLPAAIYDASAVQRLIWAHGADAASRIISGNDDLTDQDIAAWRQLGADQ